MEKKFKKHWIEFYVYPSDFFEGIGNALTALGLFFSFDASRETKPNFGLRKNRKKMERKGINR